MNCTIESINFCSRDESAGTTGSSGTNELFRVPYSLEETNSEATTGSDIAASDSRTASDSTTASSLAPASDTATSATII